MSPWRNSAQHYGGVAIALHWTMAALLCALIALGLYMVQLPDAGFDTRKIILLLSHKQLGLVAFLLALLRLAWRLGQALPDLVGTLPDWQKVIARLVHLCLYALMFALPVTGWLMSSAAGFTVSLLGWFDLPDLVAYDDALYHTLAAVHRWLAWLLLATTALHVAAALRHHLVFRDETLRKMLRGA